MGEKLPHFSRRFGGEVLTLEEEINYLTAAIQSLESVVNTLTTAMVTLTATASVEIKARTDRPVIEVIQSTDSRYDAEMERFVGGKRKRRPYIRAKETVPRQPPTSSCCGSYGHRYSKKCKDARGVKYEKNG